MLWTDRTRVFVAAGLAIFAAQMLAAQPVARPATPSAPAPSPDLSRAQFIATMDAQFRAQDPNGDGKLTRAEIETAERAKVLATAQSQNRQIFAQLDVDHNGALSPA